VKDAKLGKVTLIIKRGEHCYDQGNKKGEVVRSGNPTVDLNVQLKIYDLRLEKNEVGNPAIPIRQQETNDVDHIFFESAYTIRLGLAYKFTR
jgi:hypothetical protein